MELDQQLHRLHDSLNRLFDGESRPGTEGASVPNRDAASNTDDAGGVAASATLQNDVSSAVSDGVAEPSTTRLGEPTGDSQILTVVNPNYTPARNGDTPRMDDAADAAGFTTYVQFVRLYALI